MLEGLATAVLMVAWGAQAVVPWRLRRGGPGARGLWAAAAVPLLLAGALAALLIARSRPDAIFAAGLAPLGSHTHGRVLAFLAAALLVADVTVVLGRRRLENLGWPLAAAFGLAFLAAACFAAELVRAGDGPGGPLPALVAAAGCRLLVALAAGEVAAPGRPLLAPIAGLALPVYLLLLPPRLQAFLRHEGQWLTLGAATLLFLATRWLPDRLRRPAAAAAVLLAGIFLGQAASLSARLGPGPPMPVP